MFCPKCGNQVIEGKAFCGKCGANLSGAAPAQQVTKPKDLQAQAETGVQQASRPESQQTQAGGISRPADTGGQEESAAGKAGILDRIEKIGKIILVVGGTLMFISSFIRLPIISAINDVVWALVMGVGLVLSSLNLRRPIKFSKIWYLLVGVLLIVGFIITSVVLAGRTGGKGDRYVRMVKDGYLDAYPQKTVGEAFDGYLKNPKWESGVSEDREKFVNVSGKILYYDKETDIVVQFLIEDEKDGSFSYHACELNGIPQNNFFIWGLFEVIYDGDYTLGDSGVGELQDYVPGRSSIMIGETRFYSSAGFKGEMEVTLDSIEFTDGPLLYYGAAMTPDDGFTYLVAALTVKNVGTTEASFWPTCKIIYDSQYEYGREFAVDDDLYGLAPLSAPQTGYYVFMVPDAAAETEDALTLQIGNGEESISYVIRPGNKVSGSDNYEYTYPLSNYEAERLLAYWMITHGLSGHYSFNFSEDNIEDSDGNLYYQMHAALWPDLDGIIGYYTFYIGIDTGDIFYSEQDDTSGWMYPIDELYENEIKTWTVTPEPDYWYEEIVGAGQNGLSGELQTLAGEYMGDAMPPSMITINIYSSPEEDNVGNYSISSRSGWETGEVYQVSDSEFLLVSSEGERASIEIVDWTAGEITLQYAKGDFTCMYYMEEAYPLP